VLAFLEVVLYIIIGFYILGFILRFLLFRFLKKIQKQASQFTQQEPEQNRKEGEVIIDYIPKRKKEKSKPKKGEFVDYEEIKD
jgi:large-conductance mechanosensitive channel